MFKTVENSVQSAIQAIQFLEKKASLEFIESSAKRIANCFKNGGKLIIAGNGGSLCDAAHFAEEFTGFFRKKRAALPAIALTEPGHITCTGNDLGFDYIFSRGVEAYGRENDLFIGLTTSGNSQNLVNAFHQAKKQGLETIAFLGKSGGAIKGVADLEWIVEGFSTSDRIQEAHMTAIHIIIECVEKELFQQTSQSFAGQVS